MDLRRLSDSGLLNPEATPQWFAVCTRSNHEKCAAAQLELRCISIFSRYMNPCANGKTAASGSQFPLFPGYIFVRISLQERMRVLLTPGVVRLVGFDNRPAALPDEEIEALRSVLVRGIHSEPHPYLSVGRKNTDNARSVGGNGRRAGPQKRPGASGVVYRSDSPISDDRSGFG